MSIIYLLLLLGAAVCFAIAAFNKARTSFNLVALGLFLWVLVPVLQRLLGLSV